MYAAAQESYGTWTNGSSVSPGVRPPQTALRTRGRLRGIPGPSSLSKVTFSGSPSGPRRVSVLRSSRESDQGTDRRQHQRSGELEQATEGSIERPEITSRVEFENDDGDIIGKRRIPETHFHMRAELPQRSDDTR